MRIPRPRFSMKGLMIVVAISALVVAANALQQKRSAYLLRAKVESAAEQSAKARTKLYERAVRTSAAESVADEYRRLVKEYRERAEHHGRMRLKYQNAARFPWMQVPPDPPQE